MDFRNLGHRVRPDEDPCVDTYLDTDWFDQAYAGRAKVYHNIYLNERVFLRLVIVSDEGLYAIVPYKDRADAGIGMEIRRILGVDAENSEIIFHGEDNSLVLSRDGRSLIPVVDIYSYFHNRMQAHTDGRKRVLDAACVSRLQGRLIDLENGERPALDVDEIIGSDDEPLFVRQYDPVILGPFDLGLAGKKSWYPVADEDTDRLVTMAAFGGWFGLHRFAEGEIAGGLLYLMTCGCAGILPAIDIIQYLTGSRYISHVEYEDDEGLTRVRTREYLKKSKNRKWAVLCVFLAIGVAILAWRLIYQWAAPAILQELYRLIAGGVGTDGLPGELGKIIPEVPTSIVPK